MQKIECVSGLTQIDRIMEHVLHEIAREPVAALVFIGDAMEEDLSKLSLLASELGARNTPMYLFQEGDDPAVRKAFQLLAQKSGGKYFEFNPAAAHAVEQLSDQLNAIARLAVGDDTAVQLLEKRKS
jgi:hypothetical protein